MSKRDLPSNINFFMNVPVTPEGGLTFADGVSGPGRYVELRAEMDVLVLISNCPQLNNPCNATTRRRCDCSCGNGADLSEGAVFEKVLVANRGEIALPHHAHAAAHGHRIGGGLLGGRRAARCTCRAPTRPCGIGPAAAAESYLDADACSRPRSARARRPSIPGYGFLSENAEFAGRCEAAGIAFIGPTPEQIRAFGLKHAARDAGAEAGRAAAAGHRPADRPDAGAAAPPSASATRSC